MKAKVANPVETGVQVKTTPKVTKPVNPKLAEALAAVAKAKAEAAEEQKVAKEAKLAERKAKAEAKAAKVARISFTRTEACGQILRLNPDKSVDELITLADTLYKERTGKASNVKETRAIIKFGRNFLKGYNNGTN